MVKMRLEGVERLVGELNKLDRRTARKVVPKAVRAAAAPQLKASRQEAPKRSRTFAQSLALVIRRYDGAVLGVVGQDVRGKASQSKAARKRRSKAGGLSGRGHAPPMHLIANRVKAHQIAAGAGRWLAFRAGGGLVFRRSVRHPGHRGDQFLRRAANRTRSQSLRDFERKFVAELDKELPR